MRPIIRRIRGGSGMILALLLVGAAIQPIQGQVAAGFASAPAGGATISFGQVAVGASANQNIVISETGNAPLVVTQATFGGAAASDFSIIAGAPPLTINDGGAPVTLTLRCAPSVANEVRTATLTLNTNTATTPTVIYNLRCNDTVVSSATQDPNQVAIPASTIAPGVQVFTTIFPTDASGTATTTGALARLTGGITGLALRTGPYLGATMLGVLRRDRDYVVLGQNPGDGEGNFNWYLLIDAQNNRTGWASGRFLQTTGSIPVVPSVFDQIDTAPDIGARVTILGNVNVRTRPSLRAPEQTVTVYGAELIVLGRTMQARITQWLHVIYFDPNGRRYIGWIFFNYYEETAPNLIESTGRIPLELTPIR